MKRTRLMLGIAGGFLLAGVVGISTSTVTTRQGVNFRVSSHKLPAYVKVIDFLHRHYQYKLLSREITSGLYSDRERVLATFDWTRRHIQPTPKDWPVVDDHILNIIIRGYGLDDQMADVFTTLSTYAGVPAFWQALERPGSGEKLILSFANIDGKWAIFDVANGLVFRNAQGDFASAEELIANPHLITETARTVRPHGAAYRDYMAHLTSPKIPHPLRAELQMPWPRVRARLTRWIAKEQGNGS